MFIPAKANVIDKMILSFDAPFVKKDTHSPYITIFYRMQLRQAVVLTSTSLTSDIAWVMPTQQDQEHEKLRTIPGEPVLTIS